MEEKTRLWDTYQSRFAEKSEELPLESPATQDRPWDKYRDGGDKKQRTVKPWDLLNGAQRVPVTVSRRRFATCKKCPKFVKQTGQCSACGCFMRLKVKLPGAECPIGKWGKEDPR